jgi:tetratricopeptide (TPR) repeat protein
MTPGAAPADTKDHGQGEVAGTRIVDVMDWCRRFAVFGAAAALACGQDAPATREPAPPRRQQAPAPDAATRSPAQARYYEGYLADVLRGDVETAEAAYREVVDTDDGRQVVLAARASLHLAQLEALRGNRREAVELLARAQALGGQDRDVVERADQLQDDIAEVQVAGRGSVRGPPLGAELAGASPEAREKFARAERLAAGYYRAVDRPRIEDPLPVTERLAALEAAERAYGAVLDFGEPAASCAAEFRIGSLYHDLALAVGSEQPREPLDHAAMGRLRRQQRARSTRFLETARAAYRRSLASEETAAGQRWRRETQAALHSAEVLLRGND